jgi:predicted acetyltransferase
VGSRCGSAARPRSSCTTITLRVGRSPPSELYYGHVGYHVFPAARGQHYAERACRLLLPLARRHGLNPLWITCNPDNLASRRTCERLGMRLVETVAVPGEDALYLRGEREKCRYRLDL